MTIKKAWYRQLVEHAPDALLLVDSDGIIRLANHQCQTLFGYATEELLGQSVDILVPKTLQAQHRAHRKGFFHAPKSRNMGEGSDLKGVKKNGETFAVEISLSPIAADDSTFVVAAVRDITTRKQTEAQLRAVLETAPDAMVIIDDKGTITLVNQEAESMFDYQRSELIGQPIEILIPDHLRKRHQGYRGHYFEAPKRREMGIGLELSGRRRNGTTFPVEISLGPLDTEHGRWATAAVRDLSERKRVEQLEISHREMEHFSYAASHDLKAPLRNIVSLIDILKEDLESLQLPPDVQDTLELITTNTSRMHSLVQDLLEFSRVDRHERQFDKIDLNDLVNEVCQLVQHDISNANAQIHYQNLPTIGGDRLLLRQLLQNLLTNGIKFQSEGNQPRINITASESAEGWEVAVADNGVGISEEYHEKVFQVFSRLNNLQDYEGNGIGLAICKKIVDIHHGRIWVSDNQPNGAIFHFTVAKRV